MTISQLISPVLPKSFLVLFISLVLTACSTEESFDGSTDSVATGTTPEPLTEPILPPDPTPVPVANLTVSPSGIYIGQSAALSWNSTDATSCTAGWTASSATSGSWSVSPSVTTTYSIVCNGDGGSANDSVTVTVNPPPAPVPTASLSASSSAIDPGQSATLSWNSTDATSCTYVCTDIIACCGS